MKWSNPRCDSTSCPGFFVNGETLSVERCDTCRLFESDDAAALAIEALARVGLESLARRPRSELEATTALGTLVMSMLSRSFADASGVHSDERQEGES